MKYRDTLLLKRNAFISSCLLVCMVLILVLTLRETKDMYGRTRTCTQHEMAKQDHLFTLAKVRGCPPEDDKFMRIIQNSIPDARTFIDIGSNKGYTAVRFFMLWDPHGHSLTPRTWQNKTGFECGACADCQESTQAFIQSSPCSDPPEFFKTSDPNKRSGLLDLGIHACSKIFKSDPIRVFSFDGNKELVDMVNENIDPHFKHTWKVTHRAFQHRCGPSGTIRFHSNGELGSIARGPGTEEVPCDTVDSMVERNELDHVDILKIDTEGFDGHVIAGAYNTIAKTTVILFEYHTLWPEGQIDRTLYDLESNGYECYREGKNYLVKLTGCSSETVLEPSWSNIYCINNRVKDGHSIINIFDKHSIAFV